MATISYIEDDLMGARVLYAPPSNELCNYVNAQVQQYVSAVGSIIPSTVDYVMNRYKEFTDSTAVRYAEALKFKFGALWNEDLIQRLDSIGKIQQAPPTMQKYIMAMPRLRELHQNGGLSAYQGSYVDEAPTAIGNSHYDYRRITDTIIMKTKEGNYESTQHIEPNVRAEDILTLLQRSAIFATWSTVDAHLNSDDNSDPTSSWNEVM